MRDMSSRCESDIHPVVHGETEHADIHHKPLSASNMLRSSFYPLCERAGIPTRKQPDGTLGLRFHDLRHSAGSLLIQAGVRPKDVQAILRHSKVSTTMDLYVHSYDDDLRSAVTKLGKATA